MTGSAGEHWVCSMLARHGWAPALTRDGLARTDILAVGTHLAGRPSIEVQVKTATAGTRRTKWLLGKLALEFARSEHEWVVMVALPAVPKEPRAYVVPRDHATAATWVVHQNWLTEPDIPEGKRNALIGQARVDDTVWSGYEHRWNLLDQPTTDAPVLLPGWIRARAQEKRVGLPPGHPWNVHLPVW